MCVGFEQNRTHNKLCNEIIYVVEGFKKLCCGGHNLKRQLQSMSVEPS